MEKITIAIPQMGNSLFRKYMKSKYVQSLERAGAEVRWIELEDLSHAVGAATACDGLLLPGGADVAPELYGEERSEKCGKPNVLRDAAEPAILREFMKTGKPVLAICRGIQIVNVCFGGTLFQDIKDRQQVRHSDFLNRVRGTHLIEISRTSKLYEIVQNAQIMVNSIHHQAVKTVGEGLVATAKSSDGFIEALEKPDYGFLVAVQWHPEHLSKNDALQQALFDAFIAACKTSVVNA